MSDFKAKMHQIRFPLGLRPRLRWGAYSTPQTTQMYLKGLLLRKGREKGKERGREGKKERREEEVEGIWPTQTFWRGAPYGRRFELASCPNTNSWLYTTVRDHRVMGENKSLYNL